MLEYGEEGTNIFNIEKQRWNCLRLRAIIYPIEAGGRAAAGTGILAKEHSMKKRIFLLMLILAVMVSACGNPVRKCWRKRRKRSLK